MQFSSIANQKLSKFPKKLYSNNFRIHYTINFFVPSHLVIDSVVNSIFLALFLILFKSNSKTFSETVIRKIIIAAWKQLNNFWKVQCFHFSAFWKFKANQKLSFSKTLLYFFWKSLKIALTCGPVKSSQIQETSWFHDIDTIRFLAIYWNKFAII